MELDLTLMTARDYRDDDIEQMRRDIEIIIAAQGDREPDRRLVDERLQNYMASGTRPRKVAAVRQAAVNAVGKPVVAWGDYPGNIAYPDWRGKIFGYARMIPNWVAWAAGVFLLIYMVNTALK